MSPLMYVLDGSLCSLDRTPLKITLNFSSASLRNVALKFNPYRESLTAIKRFRSLADFSIQIRFCGLPQNRTSLNRDVIYNYLFLPYIYKVQYSFFSMKRAVKIILTNKDDKVLLQLRDAAHSHAGSWALFGGHIDGSETPEEALVREIQEEINYSLKDYRLIEESLVPEFGQVFWFHGTIDADLSELTLLEGDDFNFFTYEDVLKLKVAPESKKRILEYFKGRNK